MASTRTSTSGLAIFCCLLVIVVFSDSVTAQPSNSSIDFLIPPSLLVPAGNTVQQILVGIGQQIYTFNGTAWLLTNVSADLYNFVGEKVGHHFFLGQLDAKGGRATWITFTPSTRVSGKTLVSVPSPFPISGLPKDSIPWLLVQATSNAGRTAFLGKTTYVQRLFTHGGLAPVGIPAKAGDVIGSNYTALYKYSTNCTAAEIFCSQSFEKNHVVLYCKVSHFSGTLLQKWRRFIINCLRKKFISFF